MRTPAECYANAWPNVMRLPVGIDRNTQFLLIQKIKEFVEYFRKAGYAFGEKFERTIDSCLNDSDTYIVHLVEVLTYLGKEMGLSEDDLAKLIRDLKHNTDSKIDISEVYRILVDIGSDIGKYSTEFAKIPAGHPARTSWEIFLSGAESVQKQFIQGLSIRLGIFLNGDLRLVLSNDDLVPRELGERRMAVFVLVSDQNRSTQVISAMLFKFLFEDLSIAADDYGADTRIPVNFIMDEFANLGFIPNFTGIMSSVRSRKLSIMLILQTVGQLYDIFITENAGNTVISCCGTIIYLGGHDTETSEMISLKSGQASVLSDNVREKRSSEFMPRVAGGEFTTSTNIVERRVFTPKECSDVVSTGELIVISEGNNAGVLKKFPYTLHPLAFESESSEPNRIIDFTLARDRYAGYRDALKREHDAARYVDGKSAELTDEEGMLDKIGETDYLSAAAPKKAKNAGGYRGEYPRGKGTVREQTAGGSGASSSADLKAYMGNIDEVRRAIRPDAPPKPNIRGSHRENNTTMNPHGLDNH